ncbi:MAG: hypothetical protein U0Q16_32895 [Bryobacteraceae bacterium]
MNTLDPAYRAAVFWVAYLMWALGIWRTADALSNRPGVSGLEWFLLAALAITPLASGAGLHRTEKAFRRALEAGVPNPEALRSAVSSMRTQLLVLGVTVFAVSDLLSRTR